MGLIVHVDISINSRLTIASLCTHPCIPLLQLTIQDHYSTSEHPSLNSQQTSGIGLPENSPVVPQKPSHHQPSPHQIDATDKYMSLESRVSSFTQFWPHAAGIHSPWRMAMAGFFYRGESIKHYQRNSHQPCDFFHYLKQYSIAIKQHRPVCCVKWLVRQRSYIWVTILVLQATETWFSAMCAKESYMNGNLMMTQCWNTNDGFPIVPSWRWGCYFLPLK